MAFIPPIAPCSRGRAMTVDQYLGGFQCVKGKKKEKKKTMTDGSSHKSIKLVVTCQTLVSQTESFF